MAESSRSDGVAATSALWLLTALAALATPTATAQDKVFRLPGCDPSENTEEVEAIAKINYTVTKLASFHCNFTSISADQLKWYPNLEEFQLSSTNILQIEAGAFDSLSNLKVLNLQHNRIVGRLLPEDLFRNSHLKDKIAVLDFSLNDMTYTPANLLVGMNVSKLFFDYCSLREFPSFVKRPVFHKMRILQMLYNHITKLDDPETFKNNVNLFELNLGSNHINYLHADLLRPLRLIRVIDLSDNKIRFIPDVFFHNKTSLGTVHLNDNVLEYLPADAFRGCQVGVLALNNNRFTHLPVNFISELQKAGGNLMLFVFHNNPWQCACLNELLVEVKKSKVYYYSLERVFDGRHPVCVTDGEFKCHRREIYQKLYDQSQKRKLNF